jgi:archaetidylinositol phosphate synthase
MGKRVSHSWLDPYFVPLVGPLYRMLPIPRRFPPEGIVVTGHLLAIGGALGFAYSAKYWWGGLLIVAGVAGNHMSDMIDGRHARSTDQCRNGGELLDHFIDPLSFSYWMIGLAVSSEWPYLAIPAVVCLYASALLVSIKAKLMGEFTLARFGPTEYKAMLTAYGLVIAALSAQMFGTSEGLPVIAARCLLGFLLVWGVIQLIVNLIKAIVEVNAHGAEPDTTPWQLESDSAQAKRADSGTD